MIIHVKIYKQTNTPPPPHRTGSLDANSAFVTTFIHKCNRKLFSQTKTAALWGSPHTAPPKYSEISLIHREPPRSVFSDRAAF